MIVVALKWVGACSAADQAALEVALRLDGDVTVVSAGPSLADRGLREALAAGARRAVRIDTPTELRSDVVARNLAPACGDAAMVICGDASPDRGSGSVPAFLAAELGWGQALGLIAVDHDAATGSLHVGSLRLVRRLDGGRREVLRAVAPTVLSVEGSVARLRRASLPAQLAAQSAPIEVVPGIPGPVDHPVSVRPYRPRPLQLSEPMGGVADRIRFLTDAVADVTPTAETVALDPSAAATRIVESLRSWSYLPADGPALPPAEVAP